ncbi:MAG: radical SAM protein [Acidobacteriota bacterium]|nr:radical SAM protein [Acidobacteriota bacterium]
MKPRVYLADLRYNYSGVLANDTAPLGVGYMKTVIDRDIPGVESRVFAYPDRLLEAMREAPPDVLMVSNYVWNESLSLHVAKVAKRLNPGALTVMGGPNISLEPHRQTAFLEAHPELDVYILGEADFLARDVVRQFLDAGLSIPRFGAGEMPSSVYRRPDGSVYRNETWPRHQEIDEIPSPYLAGVMDEFFDGRLTPMIETNRGCPFTCTFCCQGTRWYTKVHNFSKERLREEIFYIARKVRELCPQVGAFRIADSNYGMFERDIEISSFLGETQKLYRYPTYIDATTGKNRPDRIIRSLEQVNGALVLYQAVQSLDENVLRNVKRQTIKLEAYEQLQVHLRGRGLRSNSDLILGLPGETLATHQKGLRQLLDSGINQVTNFQLMLLKGTELESEESRREFRFRSGWRILPKNFGVYDEEKVFDVEEIACETDTLTFDDYLQARLIALASAAFWHDNCFEDVIRFSESLGVKRSAWLEELVAAMQAPDSPVRGFVDDFLGETRGELFATREECVAFYHDDGNFERLLRGEIGDNLMHKYRAIASFRICPAIVECAMATARDLVLRTEAGRTIPDLDAFWQDLTRFVYLRHAHGQTTDEILAPAAGEFHYDIAGWLDDGTPADPSPYRLPAPRHVEFALSGESVEELSSALQVWRNTVPGLAKLVTRVRVACQVREYRGQAQHAAVGAA